MEKVRKALMVVFTIISCLLVLIALLSTLYNSTSIWWIKSTNFPRQQLFLLGFIMLLLLPIIIEKRSRNAWLMAFSIFLTLVIHGSFIVPYTPLTKTEVKSYVHNSVRQEDKVALFIANVYMKNRNAEGLFRIINKANPNVIFLVETDKWWQQAMQPLRKDYPYVVEYPLNNTYGLLLYSKYRLLEPKVLFLEKPTVPSVQAKVELPNKRVFIFYGIHPVPPVPSNLYPDNIGEKTDELSKLAQMIKQEQLPVIVAGDFNDVAWSATSRLFSKDSKLKDVRTGRGPFNSFNANSLIFRWPLDHIFVDSQFNLFSLARFDNFGSDHFPVFVELVLPQN